MPAGPRRSCSESGPAVQSARGRPESDSEGERPFRAEGPAGPRRSIVPLEKPRTVVVASEPLPGGLRRFGGAVLAHPGWPV